MNIKSLLETRLLELSHYSLTIANLLGVLFVWALAWFFIRLFRRVLRRGRLVHINDEGRRHSLLLLVQYFVWTLAAVAMLEVVGVDVSVLLAGSAALLVGLGLGVQQIFRDIVSGIFLLFEGTIEVGDVLLVNGTVARVSAINLRTSELLTRDGVALIIPNHKFITEDVLNWSHFADDEPARFSVRVGVSYRADERVVRETLRACADAHPDVLHDDPQRAPEVRLTDFAEEKMAFELSIWTRRPFEADALLSDLRFAIRERLAAQKVLMSKTAAGEG